MIKGQDIGGNKNQENSRFAGVELVRRGGRAKQCGIYMITSVIAYWIATFRLESGLILMLSLWDILCTHFGSSYLSEHINF